MNVSRRAFVATAVTGVGAALAGCSQSGGIELEGEDVLPVPVIGDPDADVTLTSFEDFGCPGCARYKRQVYPRIKGQYIDPAEIRYEHRDFPNPTQEPWSWEVPSAAREVHDQAGDEAFFSFASTMYAQQAAGYSYDGIESAAADLEADVDAEAVRAAAEDGTYRDEIEQERERAVDAGVQGTPTTVVDGEEVESSWQAIQEALDDALE